MKHLSYMMYIMSLSCTIYTMNYDQTEELAPFKQNTQNTPHYRWADPRDLTHGVYLAKVSNKPLAPIRVSELDFTLNGDDETLKLDFTDENNIHPLVVMQKERKFTSNKLGLLYKAHQQSEVSCLKVEHLLYPKTYKLLTIIRTFNANICDIEAYIESEETPYHESRFVNRFRLPKTVTRLFISIEDNDFNDLRIGTNTFSCQ